MSSQLRRRVIVHGLVQGVFFRESTRGAAESAGVSGWVRNLRDGTVEAVFEGPPGGVDQMIHFCRSGPPDARVDRVETFDEPVEGIAGFAIRPTRAWE